MTLVGEEETLPPRVGGLDVVGDLIGGDLIGGDLGGDSIDLLDSFLPNESDAIPSLTADSTTD